MKITPINIQIRNLIEKYINNDEEGVSAYGGLLDVRPPYQREFVYNAEQRNNVIATVRKGFPLNIMYWAVKPDKTFEVIDGQQRTMSICEYCAGKFSVADENGNPLYFHNMTPDQKEQILNYELTVYQCEGTDKEKLEWFKVVNIAGEELTDQELLNAVYSGPWLTDAKKKFSKTGCPASETASDYMSCKAIRQEYLEKALQWIANREGIKPEDYMAAHQQDGNALELWNYFSNVIEWARTLFPKKRRELKSVPWGILYNAYHDKTSHLNANELEEKLQKLMMDDDVTSKSGIYSYLITGNEKYLNIRAFTPAMKREAYERQQGICPYCEAEGREKIHYALEEMEADHITPWTQGGKTNADNCQMLCKEHNRKKSAK